jgi:hypothetical protein
MTLVKPSKFYAAPPSLRCELCRCYTENPIEEFGESADPTQRMRGRFCGEHREMLRKVTDAMAVMAVIENELSMRLECARSEKIVYSVAQL